MEFLAGIGDDDFGIEAGSDQGAANQKGIIRTVFEMKHPARLGCGS